MREIKFRAWDKELKRMFYWDLKVGFTTSNWDDLFIMQFTGLHDKNGKEIYEGDILKKGNTILVIEYWVDGGQWIIKTPDFDMPGGNGFYQAWINTHHPEVIGNIYENPELLESND